MALNTSIRGAQIKEAFAGDGLTIVSGVMSVGVDGTTITVVGDALQANAGSLDHGGLLGLADDDHTQYSLIDGTRAFTGTVSGVDPTETNHLTTKGYVDTAVGVSGAIDHGNLTGLADDDHTQYSLVDGTRAFSSTVAGVTPVADADLATKGYVDTVSGSMDHGELEGLSDDDHTQYSLVDGTRAFTGTVGGVTPAADADLATKLYVDTVSGSMDHGELEGLADDDHTQYSLVDGTRAFTGTVGGVTPTAVAHLTTKSYVDSLVQGLDWQDSVLSMTTEHGDAAASGTNRYIAPSTSGTWTDNYIYEWNVSAWDETIPTEGAAAWVEDEDALYVYNGTDWVAFGSTTNHNVLSGLQGGTADEYYHLTSTDYTWLVTNRQDNIEDMVGAMVSGNTETNIDVTYVDGAPGKLNFVVDTATTSGLGVAQFSSDNFDVAAGVVTVKDEGIAEAELDIHNAPVSGHYLQYDTTNGMQWVDVTASGVTESDYKLENESANCNGATTAFTLDTTPISNSLQVYLNGLAQEKGVGKDYTHAGTTVTFVLAPLTNDILLIHYVAQS